VSCSVVVCDPDSSCPLVPLHIGCKTTLSPTFPLTHALIVIVLSSDGQLSWQNPICVLADVAVIMAPVVGKAYPDPEGGVIVWLYAIVPPDPEFLNVSESQVPEPLLREPAPRKRFWSPCFHMRPTPLSNILFNSFLRLIAI